MRAEPLAHRWMALLLGVTLLTSGCVTLAPPPGAGGFRGARALSSSRELAAGMPPLQTPASAASSEEREQERLRRRRRARGLGTDVALASTGEVASEGTAPPGPLTCGSQAVPPSWPDFSSSREELLEPFLTCTSPAEFQALQQGMDMPRLVEALDDWRAVRLGALGPVREDAARLLNLKRAAFLVHATERYGALKAQVLALFIVHSAHDDDLRELLFLLARDKQLKQMLRLLPAFQGSEVPVQRVRLVYEGGPLKPGKAEDLKAAVSETRSEVPGVQVLFQ